MVAALGDAQPPAAPNKPPAWRRTARRWGLVFVGPQIIGMALFVMVPFLGSLVLAFANWNGLTDLTWVGFDNFRDQLSSPLLGKAVLNTLLIAVVTVPVGLGLAVTIAVAVERLKTRTLYLVVFFAPVVTSTVAVAMIWQQMFREDGPLSALLASIFNIAPPNWLGDPKLALWAVCIVSIWGGIGINVIIFLAGLQNISPSVIEAAKIDGANAWSLFWRIRIPLLSPVLFFTSVVSFISSLQTFDVVFILVNDAGPADATRTIVFHIYDMGMVRFQFGAASAASVLLLLLTLAVTAIQFGIQRRVVFVEEN